MFEELNDSQRETLREALKAKEDLAYDKRDFDTMGEAEAMLRELDRIGGEDDRTHEKGCPNLYAIGHQQAPMDCTECGQYGWHPTRECDNCGHQLCWCVTEDDTKMEELL